MNARSEREPFSAAELAAGGIALAAVALITFLGVIASRPQDPPPARPSSPAAAPQRDADVTGASPMRPSLPADGSGKPRSPASGRGVPPSPDASGPTPPASDPPVERTPAAPLATPTRETEVPPPAADPPVARTPAPAATPTRETETPSPAEAERNPLNRSDATSIQRRLRDLGYYVGDGNGVWGAASRNALRDFKSMNGLQEDDKWDRETEERLLSEQGVHAASTFIGDWGLDARDCRPRDGSAQLISISSRGAETAGGKCDFRSIKQEAAGRWRIRAACSAGGSSWSANISLRLSGPNLRWSSERGTETYIRCPRP